MFIWYVHSGCSPFLGCRPEMFSQGVLPFQGVNLTCSSGCSPSLGCYPEGFTQGVHPFQGVDLIQGVQVMRGQYWNGFISFLFLDKIGFCLNLFRNALLSHYEETLTCATDFLNPKLFSSMQMGIQNLNFKLSLFQFYNRVQKIM